MKKKRIGALFGIGLLLLGLIPPLSGAQEKADGQSLVQAANDPTASIMSVQFSGAYEYNFADDFVAPQWAINFTVKFLFPI
jgi:hypothetical protein